MALTSVPKLSLASVDVSIQTTFGKYEQVTFQIVANYDISGKLIRMTPAMFFLDAELVDVPVLPSYQLVMPVSGTTAMQKLSSSHNHKASIEYISDYSFYLHFEFLVGASEERYENSQRVNSDFFTSAGKYTGYLGMFLNIGANTMRINAPIVINPFDTSLTWMFKAGGTVIDGFDVDNDLKMSITTTSSVSAEYYLGWFREDAIGDVGNIIDDVDLFYSKVQGSTTAAVSTVPQVGSGKAFVLTQSTQRAEFTIPSASLKEGATYRAYIVYKSSGQWKSCLSGKLQSKDNVTISGTAGDGVTITDDLGNTSTNTCVIGLSPLLPVKIVGVFPLANFNGATVDYVKVFAKNGQTQFHPDGVIPLDNIAHLDFVDLGEAINATSVNDGTNITVTVQYKPDPDFIGTKSVNIVIGLSNYENCFGQYCQIIKVDKVENILLTYGPNVIDPNGIYEPVFTIDGDVLDYICSDAQTIEVDTGIVGAAFPFLVKGSSKPTYSRSLAYDAGVVTVDKSLIKGESSTCVTLVSKGTVIAYDPCFGGTLHSEVLTVWDFNPWGIWTIKYTIDGGAEQTRRGSSTEVIIGTSGTIVVTSFTYDNYSAAAAPTYQILEFDIPSLCPPVVCDNATYIEYTCVGDTITLTPVDVTNQTPTATTYTATIDGVTAAAAGSYVGETSVTVYRRLDFADCPSVEATQVINCSELLNKSNIRTILASNAGLDVTITVTDSFQSTILEDIQEISSNGGATWTTYGGGAFTLPSNATEVIYRYNVSFTDGSMPLTDEIILDVLSDCDYTGLSVSASYDPVTGLYSAASTGTAPLATLDEIRYSSNGTSPILGSVYSAPIAQLGVSVFSVVRVVQLAGCSEAYFFSSAIRPLGNYTRYAEAFELDGIQSTVQLTENAGLIDETNLASYDIYYNGVKQNNLSPLQYTVTGTGLVSIFESGSPYVPASGNTLQVIWWY